MGEIVKEDEEEEELKPLNDNKIYADRKKVEIVIRTVGPARPSRLHVPSPIKVRLTHLPLYLFLSGFFLFLSVMPPLFLNLKMIENLYDLYCNFLVQNSVCNCEHSLFPFLIYVMIDLFQTYILFCFANLTCLLCQI